MRMPRGITKVGDDLYELKLTSGQVARFNADDAYAVWKLSEKLFLDGEIRYRIEMAERDIPRCGETYDLGRLNDHGRAVLGPLTMEEVDWLVEEAFAIRLYEGEELTLDQVVANAAEGLFDQRRREEDERSFSEMCERLGADERAARESVMRDAAADWPCGPAAEALVRSLESKQGPEGAPEADMALSPHEAMILIESYSLGELDSSQANLYSEMELLDLLSQSDDPLADVDAASALSDALCRHVADAVFRGDIDGFHVLSSAEEVAGAMGADMDEVLRCKRVLSNASGQEPLDSQTLAAIRAAGQEEGRATDGPDGRGDR